jgi:hypothetical protein
VTRKSFDEDTPLPPHGKAPALLPSDRLHPCGYCGEQTAWKTLSALGARCQRCYDQFLRVGYSGANRPREHRPAAWVAQAAKRVVRAPTVFTAMADRMRERRAEVAAPQGLDDDDVNALLREAP